MESEAAIKHKIREALYRHLQRRLRQAYKKRPDTCFYNGRPEAPHLPCMCLYGTEDPSQWKGIICDINVPGGMELARNCPLWQPKQDKQAIQAEFVAGCKGNKAQISSKYPDVAALMWVLGVDSLAGIQPQEPDPVETVEDEEAPEEDSG